MPQITASRCFPHFKNGNFVRISNELSHTGRPIKFDEEGLKTFFIKINDTLPEQINCDLKTVVNHLHAIGKF